MTTSIFEVKSSGQDGTDGSVVGYVSNSKLAWQLALGRGAMGQSDGELKEITVWDSLDDLPADVRAFVDKEIEKQTKQRVAEAEKQIDRIIRDLGSKFVDDYLLRKKLEDDDSADDIPF